MVSILIIYIKNLLMFFCLFFDYVLLQNIEYVEKRNYLILKV